ncbi:FHA domain-containing protein [Kribbella sp. NPDC000426]|uniref:FHA domain-containing protein n=1 Tax=Kribbella sp. NPDC000426 TaxID=3154255 RepID=UPI0033343BA4
METEFVLSLGEQRWTLPPEADTITIGRASNADIRLQADDQISRIHARLTREATTWTLHDESRNGTGLNGHRITAPTALSTGDRIHIGRSVLTFHKTSIPDRVSSAGEDGSWETPAPAGPAAAGGEPDPRYTPRSSDGPGYAGFAAQETPPPPAGPAPGGAPPAQDPWAADGAAAAAPPASAGAASSEAFRPAEEPGEAGAAAGGQQYGDFTPESAAAPAATPAPARPTQGEAFPPPAAPPQPTGPSGAFPPAQDPRAADGAAGGGGQSSEPARQGNAGAEYQAGGAAQYQREQPNRAEYRDGQADPAEYRADQPDQAQYQREQAGPAEYRGGEADRAEYQGGQADPAEYQGGQPDPAEYQGDQADPAEYQGRQADPAQYQREQADPAQYQREQADPAEYSGDHAGLAGHDGGQAEPTQYQGDQPGPAQYQGDQAEPGRYQRGQGGEEFGAAGVVPGFEVEEAGERPSGGGGWAAYPSVDNAEPVRTPWEISARVEQAEPNWNQSDNWPEPSRAPAERRLPGGDRRTGGDRRAAADRRADADRRTNGGRGTNAERGTTAEAGAGADHRTNAERGADRRANGGRGASAGRPTKTERGADRRGKADRLPDGDRRVVGAEGEAVGTVRLPRVLIVGAGIIVLGLIVNLIVTFLADGPGGELRWLVPPGIALVVAMVLALLDAAAPKDHRPGRLDVSILIAIAVVLVGVGVGGFALTAGTEYVGGYLTGNESGEDRLVKPVAKPAGAITVTVENVTYTSHFTRVEVMLANGAKEPITIPIAGATFTAADGTTLRADTRRSNWPSKVATGGTAHGTITFKGKLPDSADAAVLTLKSGGTGLGVPVALSN